MMFCCVGLKNLIGTAGQRGMSALVYKTPRGFRFNLQSRALSREAELYLTRVPTPLLPLPIQGDKNMTVSVNIGLNYCPFCGTKLQTLVTWSTKKHFEALAEEHKKFDERPL
jgi:hypothetical protein